MSAEGRMPPTEKRPGLRPAPLQDSRIAGPLKGKLRRKLELPRIEHRSRQTKSRIRAKRDEQSCTYRSRSKSSSSPWRKRDTPIRAGRCSCLDRTARSISIMPRDSATAEYGRAIDWRDLIHVRPVEQVERIHTEVHLDPLGELEVPPEMEIPGVQRIANIRVPGNHRRAVTHIGTVARDQRAADAVGCSSGHIVQGVISIEHCERSAGLEGDNAAQRKVADERILWPSRREVRHEAMASILVGVRTFCRVVELVHRKIDERGEVAVVNRVRVGVVGGQAEILDALDNRQRSAMIYGVRDVVVVVLQPSIERLQA